MAENTDVPAAPKWIYDEVIPAVGTRVRSLHLLKQKGGRKSVLLFAEEAALVAEKGLLSGVKVYRVDYPRGLLLNESECPHCHKQIQEPVGKVARLVGAKPAKDAPTFTSKPPAGKGVNVIDIEGIGPVFAEKLGKQGISTIAELRRADAATLAQRIDAPENTVRQWQSMGELMGVKGIGPQYAELLVRSGVESVAALRKTDPKKLLAAIETTNEGRQVAIQGNPVGPKLVKGWIGAAKKHKK
jgi:predicted flap endonuclease-1-like 5' DNA nuclease